jgi:uncharacterized repeat protein (TIGR01451 family)
VAISVLLTAEAASAGDGVWTSDGPDGGPVIALEWDPTASGTVHALTRYNGVFSSDNPASGWLVANAGLPLDGPTGLAVAIDGTLYAAFIGSDSGLFRSSDAGASWQEVLNQPVSALAADPTAAGSVYAATGESRVFRTTDGGSNWTSSATGLPESEVCCLLVDHSIPSTLYLGTADKTVFKSVDSGVTWTKKDVGIKDLGIISMAIDPMTPSTVYAATTEGVFVTSNGAADWVPIPDDPPGIVTKIVVDPSAPSRILAAGFDVGQVFMSLDSGTSWSALGGGIPAARILALGFSPQSPAVILLGTGAGVSRSSDSGASWSETSGGLRSVRVDRVVVDPSAPQTLYAASPESGIFRSLDGGGSWITVNQGLGSLEISALDLSASLPQRLFAAQGIGLRRTDTGGGLWADPVTDPEDFGFRGPEVVSLGADRLSEDRLFALNSSTKTPLGGGPGILRSTDAAVSWNVVLDFPDLTALVPGDLVLNPTDPNSILVSFSGRETLQPKSQFFVFQSIDGGASWNETFRVEGTGQTILAVDESQTSKAYLVANPGDAFESFRSTNGGASWAPFQVAAPCVNALLPGPIVAGDIWVGCNPVYLSEDSGATWSQFDATGFPTEGEGALALAQVGGSSPTLHAGTSTGVFSYGFPTPVDLSVSKDDGLTELEPGDPLVYTIIVTNPGGEAVIGATVTDLLPGALSCSWACVAAGGASCTASPPAGDLDESVDVPVGASATFTANCTVGSSAAGLLTNTVSVATPEGTVDLAPGDNSATDIDVVLEMGACGAFNDRILSNVTFASAETVEACKSILAGPNVIVEADVIFRSPFIALASGFRVVSGTFTAFDEAPVP